MSDGMCMSNDSRNNSGSSGKGLKSRLQNTSLQVDLVSLKQKATGFGKKIQEKMVSKSASGGHAGSARQLKDNGYDSVNLADSGEIFILRTQNKIDFDDMSPYQCSSASMSTVDFNTGSEKASFKVSDGSGYFADAGSASEQTRRVEFNISTGTSKSDETSYNDIKNVDFSGIIDNMSSAPSMGADPEIFTVDRSDEAPAIVSDVEDAEEAGSTFSMSVGVTEAPESAEAEDELTDEDEPYEVEADVESEDDDDFSVESTDYDGMMSLYRDNCIPSEDGSEEEIVKMEIPVETVSYPEAEIPESVSADGESDYTGRTEIPMEIVASVSETPVVDEAVPEDKPIEVVVESVPEPVEKLRLGPAEPSAGITVKSSLPSVSVNEIEGVKGLTVEGEVSKSVDSVSTGVDVTESLQMAETSAGAVQSPGYMNLTADGEGVRTLSDPKRKRPTQQRSRTMRFKNGVLQNTEPQEELQGPLV